MLIRQIHWSLSDVKKFGGHFFGETHAEVKIRNMQREIAFVFLNQFLERLKVKMSILTQKSNGVYCARMFLFPIDDLPGMRDAVWHRREPGKVARERDET